MSDKTSILAVRLDAFIEMPGLMKYVDYSDEKVYYQVLKAVKLNRECLTFIEDEKLNDRLISDLK